MHAKLAGLTAVGLLLFAATAWSDEKAKDTGPRNIQPAKVELGRPVDYDKDIYPILDANCVACHNLAVSESRLSLEDVPSMLKGGKRGPAIVPGKPDESLLLKVATRSVDPAMPPLPNEAEARALTPQELGLLRQWILEGAKGGSEDRPEEIVWQPIPSGLKAIYSLDLSRDGRFVAAGRANRITIYDVKLGEPVAQLVDPALAKLAVDGKPFYPGAAHRDFVHALAFDPQAKLLASGGYRVVKLWQRDPNVRRFDAAVGSPVLAVTLSPDGKWLAMGLENGTIRLKGLDANAPEKTLSGHQAAVSGVAFTPDGSRLVSASQDKTLIVWNVADGQQAARFEAPAPIGALALSPDGKQIITGHQDNVIRIWDTQSVIAPPKAEQKTEAAGKEDAKSEQPAVKPVRELKGHGKPITSLALTADGSQLVSGSEDTTVRLWRVNDAALVRAVNLGGPVTAVAVSPDGKVIAAAGANNLARIWDANGKQLGEMRGDPDAQRAVTDLVEEQTVAKQRVALSDAALKAAEKDVQDRDAAAKKAREAKQAADKALAEAEKKVKETAEAAKAAREAAEKKPDDKGLQKKRTDAEKAAGDAVTARDNARKAQERAARTLAQAETSLKRAQERLAAAKSRHEAELARQKQIDTDLEAARKREAESQKPFRAIAISPDGKRLALAGDGAAIQLRRASDGAPLEVLGRLEGPVRCLAFATGGTLLAGSADGHGSVWETTPRWQLVAQLGPPADDPENIGASLFVDRVLALDFSPDGKWLATGGGEPSRSGELTIWDVAQRRLVRYIGDAHSDTVFDVEISRDGKYLLSGSADKFAKIHDLKTGELVQKFEGHTHHVLGIAWKADGGTIATCGADNAIKIWNAVTGEQRRTINNYSKQVTSIEFIGTSDNIVSCGGDRTVRFHRTSNGSNYRNFGGETDFVYDVAAMPDESLVVAGGEDGVLRVWNGKNSQLLFSFEPPPAADGNQTQAAR